MNLLINQIFVFTRIFPFSGRGLMVGEENELYLCQELFSKLILLRQQSVALINF